MNYRELQQALKGHTSIKLNSKREVLQAEYDRLFVTQVVEEVKEEEYVNTEVIAAQADAGYCELASELACTLTSEVILSCPVPDSCLTTLACPLPPASVKQPEVLPEHLKPYALDNETPEKRKAFTNIDNGRGKRENAFKMAMNMAPRQRKAFLDALGVTERKAIDNVVQFAKAVKGIAVGFHNRQVERNAA